MKYIHEFQNNTEFENYYFGQNYIKPHVSWTVDVDRLDYNKSGNEDYEYWKNQELTFQILTDGTVRWNADALGSTAVINYRYNGSNWIGTSGSYKFWNVKAGDVLQFRAKKSSYANDTKHCYFACTCQFNLCGNIMSMIDNTKFVTVFSSTKVFSNLFENCSTLINAKNLVLPATTLTEYCYHQMFKGCTSLISAPTLPATTLANNCYTSMFQGCKSLITVPELPATTLANNCYQQMFDGCTSLTSTQELPATTLANDCYVGMFQGCTGLTTAPALPATTLANYCYQHMFKGCTSLTSAPELPATTLVSSCYSGMFWDCTSLNYVKCLATNISASNALTIWLSNVSSTGTFYKAAGVTYPSGASGIPTGWTVQDITNE